MKKLSSCYRWSSFAWRPAIKALNVNEEKEYQQIDAPPTTDLLTGGTDIVLKPDGTVTILPGRDIILNATYDISGKKSP